MPFSLALWWSITIVASLALWWSIAPWPCGGALVLGPVVEHQNAMVPRAGHRRVEARWPDMAGACAWVALLIES